MEAKQIQTMALASAWDILSELASDPASVLTDRQRRCVRGTTYLLNQAFNADPSLLKAVSPERAAREAFRACRHEEIARGDK